MARPPSRKPKYCHDRTTGRAYVTLSGRRFYLGDWDTPESRDAYDRRVGEWIAAGRRMPPPPAGAAPNSAAGVTVALIVARFWTHAQTYYPAEKGRGEAANFKAAVRVLVRLYRDTPAAAFGPLALRAVRDAMVDAGGSRTYVNAQVGRIRRVFRWAVEQELIAAETWQALLAVKGLGKGRGQAREAEPVRPVADDLVDATIPHLTRVTRAMVELQRETGMRSAEVCILRTADVDRSGAVWVYRPSKHKTEHHELSREVFLTRRAQEILTPWLRLATPLAYAFRPMDAREERAERLAAARRTKASQGNGPGTNRVRRPKRAPGERYTPNSYRQAVIRACDAAFPITTADLGPRPETAATYDNWVQTHRWHPHRLRHAYATKARRVHGLEVTRILLGHQHAKITEVYAERDRAAAISALA